MQIDDQVWLLGIRHHGPGCASSLKRALAEIQPEAILLEGAQELQDSWQCCGDPGLVPPVAQLVYDPKSPAEAVFYPWAEFSPEWQAMHYALRTGCALEMMDLPVGIELERRAAEVAKSGVEAQEAQPTQSPLDRLAEAAGYSDGESWWDWQVEHLTDGLALFEAIGEAMSALREALPEHTQTQDLLREAWMRRVLRKARKTYGRIAVVCGAWHVPALAAKVKVKEDNALLKGLKKRRVAVAWVPYTYARFCQGSGYGAGIPSPGWYAHLFRHQQQGSSTETLVIDWMSRIAQLLRREGFLCSSAEVIEGVRLALALARLRGQPVPGLRETLEAAQSVMTQGQGEPLFLIQEQLVVSNRLGKLPPGKHQLPLEQDLEAQSRRLRLHRSEAEQVLSLDLRKPMGLQRSILFHRLQALGIPWGTPLEESGLGTFKESWVVQWQPEFALALIDASTWGSTVEAAASQRLAARIAAEENVSGIADLLSHLQAADLPELFPKAADQLRALAALSADLQDLMKSLLTLVQIQRYGSVRSIRGELLEPVIEGMILRITNGLATACLLLDQEAAYTMLEAMDQAHSALHMRERPEDIERWLKALGEVVAQEAAHPVILGRCTRRLYDLNRLDAEALARAFQLALSSGNDAPHAAAWIEGLLYQGATLLLYEDGLFRFLDRWLGDLAEEDFLRVLPLLRRVFSSFSPQELHLLGDRVRHGSDRQVRAARRFDPDLQQRALVQLRQLLGIEPCKT